MVEIKAVRAMDELHVAQAMNYLKASGMLVCLLINFGRPKIEVRRFVPYDVWKESKPLFAHHHIR